MNRQIYNKTITVDGVDIFYREAGEKKPSLIVGGKLNTTTK